MLIKKVWKNQTAILFIQLAFPIALQNLLSSSLAMCDMIFVGQLGSTPVAAVALANKVLFLLTIFFFGLSSGTSVIASQFWGARDRRSIHMALNLSLAGTTFVSLLFFLIAFFFPLELMGIFSSDSELVRLSAGFLRIISFSYLFTGITSCFTSVMRSVGEVRTPVLINVFAIFLNSVLNLVLIFGTGSIPALGVNGSAWATVISRILECSVLLFYVYAGKKPANANPLFLLLVTKDFLKTFFKTVLPVVTDEFFWGMTLIVHTFIYARIGTSALAAANIAQNIEFLAISAFFGYTYAAGILIGNSIGAGEVEKGKSIAKKTLIASPFFGLIIAILFYLLKDIIIPIFHISPAEQTITIQIFTVITILMPLRVTYMLLLTGVLRNGGNTVISMLIDSGISWLVGVPLAFLALFLFHLPVYLVAFAISFDYIVKTIIGFRIFRSGKWILQITN